VVTQPVYPPRTGAKRRPLGRIFLERLAGRFLLGGLFERPVPTPSPPSTIAAQVKCRSCGGPSAERTT
jgi:hypothetical protein